MLHATYGVSLPIRGVMYCTLEWSDSDYKAERMRLNIQPGRLHECLVLQDSFGDYYYYYEFSQGGDRFIAKFWAPRGICAGDFVKNYFKGAVKDVDMDRVLPRCESKYESLFNDLLKEQKELAKLHEQARDQVQCACWR
jgi:hypothetical protein